MEKSIILKLKGVKYSGQSIGDDLRIEIKILGQTFSFKKKIVNNSEYVFNKIITEIDTDKENFETDINLKIIEDDPIFNDVGVDTENLKIITVANKDGKIVGIYPGAKIRNLPYIMKNHIDLVDKERFKVCSDLLPNRF